MKKFIYTTLAFVLGIAMFAPVANASVQFNTDPQDMRTVLVTNHTQNACSGGQVDGCWKTSTTANPGDEVSVMVYYHNTGDETAYNVTLGMNNPTSSTAKSSYTFYGGVSANDFPAKTASASVQLTSAQTLTFVPGSVRFYPNQTTSGRSVAGETALFTQKGVAIGNVTPGWDSQGSIVATFKVGNKTTPPVQHEQCRIDSFVASDYTIYYGDSTTLRWKTTNCDYVTIYPTVGRVNDEDGSVTVRPTASTKYTLNATGQYGSDTATLTVTVRDRISTPVCSPNFTADAYTITRGGSTYLRWNATGASSVRIVPDVNAYSINGSVLIRPTVTTTYTLYAYDCNGGTRTAAVTIAVIQPVKTVVVTQPVKYVPVVTQTAPSIKLEIMSDTDKMCPAGDVQYTVSYRNVSKTSVRNAILTVELPRAVEYRDSADGDYSSSDRTVTFDLGTISAGEQGEVVIDTTVRDSAESGDTAEVHATMNYGYGSSKHGEATAHWSGDISDSCPCDSDDSKSTGAINFGSFLPDTLLEWLLLILVILGLIVLGRQLSKNTDK